MALPNSQTAAGTGMICSWLLPKSSLADSPPLNALKLTRPMFEVLNVVV